MSEITFLATANAVARLGDFARVDDDALIAAQRVIAEHRRELDAVSARNAAEIARRSDPQLGFGGLAHRRGFVNTAALLQSVSGSSRAEAATLAHVGELMNTPASPMTGELSWRGVLGGAVESGRVGVDSANAIRVGLGGTGTPVADELLSRATEVLLDEAETLDVDQLHRRARAMRDELDAEGIAAREKERRDLRDFRVRRRPDGMVVGSFALSDEDGALALAIYEQATGPKRLGPRFVDTTPDAKLQSEPEEILDPRTRGQKAADAFAGLLRIGTETSDSAVLGLSRPSVRIHVNAEAIAARSGHGVIEGASDYPISFATVERHLCASGVIGVAFDDDGQSLNVGRDQRLYTRRQRIALAARDGGCRFPGCDRPPSWTEAHHIDYWGRDSGPTSLDNGILLCRLHHLLVHDNHWQIRRDRADYWLIPPADVDARQVPRPMPSRRPRLRALTLEPVIEPAAAPAETAPRRGVS